MMPYCGNRPFFLEGITAQHVLVHNNTEVCSVSKYFCVVHDAPEMIYPISSGKEKENYKLFD
jgi:hypothetical protein